MSYAPFLVANYRTGIDQEVEPWLLPKDAFSEMTNCYLDRGVIKKREGYTLFAQMQHGVANVSAITISPPADIIITTSGAHGRTTGDVVSLNNILGTTQLNGRTYTITVINGTQFSLDGVTGVGYTPYVSGGIVGIESSDPIMGIHNYLAASGIPQLLVFDTVQMAIYNPNTFQLVPYSTANIFSGSDIRFFWAENFRASTDVTDNRLYITNFADQIKVWDGTTLSNFVPQYGSTGADIVNRCLFIFAIKQRLLLLYTEEAGTIRAQRARWSQAQNPSDTVSPGVNAWDQNVPGRGGYVDAPTGESIISARPLGDVLLVQFSNSWWSLRPTSDPALPFRWDKINPSRGIDAPFSGASYDKYVAGIGKTGIVACNGVEALRIDQKIPEFVKTITQNQIERVYTRRFEPNYQSWSLYPDDTFEGSERCNRVLIFNEKDGAWSKYNMALSVLGETETQQDPAWEDYKLNTLDTAPLPPYNWSDFDEETWASPLLQENSLIFLGGNYTGTVYQLNSTDSDLGTAIEMELLSAQWNPFQDKGVKCQMGYVDFLLDTDVETEITVEVFCNNDYDSYKTQKVSFLPQTNEIGPIDQAYWDATNLWTVLEIDDHGLSTGDSISLYQMEGMTSLNGGTYTVTVIDEDTLSIAENTSLENLYTGNGLAVQGNFNQDKVWKRVYAGAVGFSHRIKITNNRLNQNVAINAIMPWFRPLGTRMIGI